MARDSATRTLSAALGCLSLAVSGCVLQSDYSIKVTTADDVTIEVPLAAKASIDAEDDVMKVANFRFVPLSKDLDKALGYYFDLQFKGNHRAASIAVDDVSEPPILNILEDNAPKLVNKDHWVGASKPYSPADEHMTWVTTLDNGVRVFRFTVKMTDGTTDVLRLPILMPANTKSIFRNELGLK